MPLTPGAMRIWQQFREREGAKRLTIDSRDPELLGLPWELLADQGEFLFALDIMLRRRVHRSGQALTAPRFEVPIRVLMVTARPKGLAFIDPRASARALLDAVAPLGDRVEVEFLDPPTFSALSRRLRDRDRPVQVLHFDGHGVYDSGRNVYDSGQGYLAFEDAKGGVDRVSAERIGTLMANARTPLLVMDACESAKVESLDPFRSVAPRLNDAGVGSVVAMPYSVLVKTSERFFRDFYTALARGSSVGRAVDQGRWALHDQPRRLTIALPDRGEVPVELQDWFLPVLYQRGGDPAPFAAAKSLPGASPGSSPLGHAANPGLDTCAWNRARTDPVLLGAFREPHYCFIGRAHELWTLQRRLRDHRVVVLHGLAGQGKTALATETARWLTRTGRFSRAVMVSFADGGDRDAALAQIGAALIGDGFAALGADERLPALQRVLDREPVLLVWDNFESILPGWEAALPDAALKALLETDLQLSRGASRLLITSRDPQLAPHHPRYRRSRQVAYLALKGMAPEEALELAGAVLDDQGLARLEREDLQRLLDYLGDHPLSMLLVLPHLRDYDNDVGQVIHRFEELYPGFTDGQAKERNQSLDLSMKFSLDRLSAKARERLPVLGAFRGGALAFAPGNVAVKSSGGWGEQGKALVAELEQAGLLERESVRVSRGAMLFIFGEDEPPAEAYTQGQGLDYYRFHSTLAPYLRRQWDTEQRWVYRERHRRLYYALANRLSHLDSRDPASARAMARIELPNLLRGLEAMLEAGEPGAMRYADSVEEFLDLFGRWRERDALLARVREWFSVAGDGPLDKNTFLALSQRGKQLRDQGQGKAAERVFHDLLGRMDSGMAYVGQEVGYDRAVTLRQLGLSLGSQGRANAAEQAYRGALEVLAGLDQAHRAVRSQTGVVHTDLAGVLMALGRYDQARGYYEQALIVNRELGGTRGAAVDNGQLGTLALMQRDYPEARRRYRAALQAFKDLKEPWSIAVLLYQLAMVAQHEAETTKGEARRALLEEAEQGYRHSLRQSEGMRDYTGAAQSAGQLATIADMAGRYAYAESWYRRALGWFEQAGQRDKRAKGASNYAIMLLRVHRLPVKRRPIEFQGRELLAEAAGQAETVVGILEALGDPSQQIWKTYGLLAEIAGARAAEADKDPAEVQRQRVLAGQWRQQERLAYAVFPGHWARLRKAWGPRVELAQAAIAGDPDAKAPFEDLLQKMAELRSWNALAEALRAVLASARDAQGLAETHQLDRQDYLILTKVLEGLALSPPTPSPK